MGGGKVIEVHSAAEFEKILHDKGTFGGSAAVLVDWTATWCGPCKQIAPVFAQLSERPEFAAVRFVKCDVDELNDLAGSAGVRAMPTFQAYFNGSKVDELTGADPGRLQALATKLAGMAASASSGAGHKVGGSGGEAAAPAPAAGSSEMRERMAAAAEARLKAMGQ